MEKFSPIFSCQACPIISQLDKNANCQFGACYEILINRTALALKSWQIVLVKHTFSFAKFTGDMQRPIRICQIIEIINA